LLSHSQTYIEELVGHFTYKLGLFICNMKEMLGFLGTKVFASPPLLGTPGPLNDGHVVSLGSPPLPAREWTHEATKHIVELVKEALRVMAQWFLSNNVGRGS
jgi:hypothetical protein